MREVLRIERTQFGGNYNVGLVWALETLAWSPEHLPEASMLLARLAALDPGGNSHPRPAGALVSIFLPWYPQTTANLDGRIAALEAVAKHVPEVAMKVISELFRKSTSSPTHRPAVRDWTAGWREGASDQEIDAIHERIGTLAVTTATTEPSLWALLVTELRWLPRSAQDAAYRNLATLEAGRLTDSQQSVLRDSVRRALNFGATHPDSQNAPGRSERELLKRLLERLAPSDVRELHRWLFAGWVHLPVWSPEISAGIVQKFWR